MDLSWTKLRPECWLSFLQIVKENKSLVSLNISHNKILESQPKPTPKELAKNPRPLTKHNEKVLSCFKDFIKYNIHLVSLNLENTGLIEPAVVYLGSLLTKSQGLRCLHLCANEGITPGVVEEVRERIKAKVVTEAHVIQPY